MSLLECVDDNKGINFYPNQEKRIFVGIMQIVLIWDVDVDYLIQINDCNMFFFFLCCNRQPRPRSPWLCLWHWWMDAPLTFLLTPPRPPERSARSSPTKSNSTTLLAFLSTSPCMKRCAWSTQKIYIGIFKVNFSICRWPQMLTRPSGVGSGQRAGARDGRHLPVWAGSEEERRPGAARSMAPLLPQGGLHPLAWQQGGQDQHRTHLQTDHPRSEVWRVPVSKGGLMFGWLSRKDLILSSHFTPPPFYTLTGGRLCSARCEAFIHPARLGKQSRTCEGSCSGMYQHVYAGVQVRGQMGPNGQHRSRWGQSQHGSKGAAWTELDRKEKLWSGLEPV